MLREIITILWHFTRCGEFSKGLLCLIVSSEDCTHVEILTAGTVEKRPMFMSLLAK